LVCSVEAETEEQPNEDEAGDDEVEDETGGDASIQGGEPSTKKARIADSAAEDNQDAKKPSDSGGGASLERNEDQEQEEPEEEPEDDDDDDDDSEGGDGTDEGVAWQYLDTARELYQQALASLEGDQDQDQGSSSSSSPLVARLRGELARTVSRKKKKSQRKSPKSLSDLNRQ
jgi:hypothetical protein